MADTIENTAAIQRCFEYLELKDLKSIVMIPDPEYLLATFRGSRSDPDVVAAALVQGCPPSAIQSYISSYHRSVVVARVDSLVEGRNLLAYAVHSNSQEIVQLLLECGAGTDLTDYGQVPILARAIIQTKWTVKDTKEIVKTLLAHGANPNVIPTDMWESFIGQPQAVSVSSKKNKSELASWCKPGHRAVLAETLHRTHRYLLWRANRMARLAARKKQVASNHNIQLLFEMPFLVIGQEHACKLVTDTIFADITFPTSKPLVLAFAGSSGHGKTELAAQMGQLLKVTALEIDCTQTSTEFGVLGSALGYHSNEEGSPLNNFLANNANKRCVVLLDEFDKTTKEVREALLKVTDTGMYRDRRTGGGLVDTSRCIWIMASNLGDSIIERYYFRHLSKCKDEDAKAVSIESLKRDLQREFREKYTPAVAGRIDNIVPLFPFSPNEQAVVAHKFLLSLQDEARKPIDLKHPAFQHVGHAHVNIREDGRLCLHIAKTGYTYQQVGQERCRQSPSNVS